MMPEFSHSSKERLSTCHVDLMRLFNRVVKQRDCTVLYGYRTPEEQMRIFKSGRRKINGEWRIVDRLQVRTYKDGYKKLSNHNKFPSMAVDVVPYPIDWEDIDRFKDFASYVKAVADELGIKVTWGGDWANFQDMAHWELKIESME